MVLLHAFGVLGRCKTLRTNLCAVDILIYFVRLRGLLVKLGQ